jgi:homoserine O-acetyltransferase/O-succinyltransferase
MTFSITKNSDGSYIYHNNAPYVCANGVTIPDFYLQFETYGDIKSPVIVVNHALSTSCHLSSASGGPDKGWWENNVAANASIDINKFFTICIANLGGNFGASNAANTTKDFPSLSILDLAKTQIMVLNALNIKKIYAIIGNSIGGFASLMLAIKLGARVEKLISVSSSAKAYPNYQKIHKLQRNLIRQDPLWNDGKYLSNIFPGMLAARKLGLLSYINLSELTAKIPNSKQRKRYLNYNAIKFCKNFDPMVYVKISEMVSSFDCEALLKLENISFSNLSAKTTIISVTTDALFLPQQQQDLYAKIIDLDIVAEIITVSSSQGHDAFYTDNKIAAAIKDALSN